jgi:hypothetical protein
MKWPLIRTTLNSMMISAIPCLHAEVRHSGTQACDLKKMLIGMGIPCNN